MITRIFELETYAEFVNSFICHSEFSDPHFTYNSDNLYGVWKKKNQVVLRVDTSNEITGLFVFLILEDERYIEMLIGFSRSKAAYQEIWDYLQENYKGYSVDFVYNPKNYLLQGLMEKNDAKMETEQLKMIYRTEKPIAVCHDIQVLSENYKEQYLKLHNRECYWTGEKVLEAADRFRVLLAIEEQKVIGYLDVTYCFAENEPYDLFVDEEHQNQGVEAELMFVATRMNKPSGMIVLVDVDKPKEIAIYSSVGFVVVENQNSVVAHVREL